MAAPSVFVVILNWNGGEDTVACLRSLSRQTFKALRMVVVDNGSQDDSLARIAAWAAGDGALPSPASYDPDEARAGGREPDETRMRARPESAHLVLVASPDNLGFAAGSNLGIRYALGAGAELVLLLNNDTAAEPEAIERLVGFMIAHPEYCACTGQIRYMDRPVTWNCGGDLTWFGSRRYLFSEQPVSSTPQSGWRRISFITGGAALMRASVFANHGLFTERFFFGEEDYELSLRMKRAGCPIACTFDAVIHHRVGSSIDRAAPPAALGRYYIYYLNRFIDMRDYYPRPVWWLWRLLSLSIVLPRLRRSRGFGWRSIGLLGRRLLRDSAGLDGVTRDRFETATRRGLEAL